MKLAPWGHKTGPFGRRGTGTRSSPLAPDDTRTLADPPSARWMLCRLCSLDTPRRPLAPRRAGPAPDPGPSDGSRQLPALLTRQPVAKIVYSGEPHSSQIRTLSGWPQAGVQPLVRWEALNPCSTIKPVLCFGGGLIAFFDPTSRAQYPLPGALPQLALQSEHLLTKGEDLPVTIITEQAGDQRGKRREEHEKQVPEHAGEIAWLQGEVNSDSESSPTAAGNARGSHRLVWGPYGMRSKCQNMHGGCLRQTGKSTVAARTQRLPLAAPGITPIGFGTLRTPPREGPSHTTVHWDAENCRRSALAVSARHIPVFVA